jgi:hypothetical protein
MAKRHRAIGRKIGKHPHKTKKRLATKQRMLAARKARDITQNAA